MVASFVYGLLFHGATLLCAALLGPVPRESADVFPLRDVAYIGIASLASAAIVTAVWTWRHKGFASSDAWAVGAISIALILANLIAARGLRGLPELFTSRPVHMSVSFLFAFLAVPVCAWIAKAVRHGSGSGR
jgi:hypothetical protein